MATNYTWDEDNILYETDDNDIVTAKYTYNPEEYGELICERRDSHTYTHHYDAQGSTVSLTDEASQIASSFEYEAWGGLLTRAGSTDTPFEWIGALGYVWDADCRQFSIRRRRYEPEVNRWLSPDPLDTSPLHHYLYAQANPRTRLDPSGLVAVTFIPTPTSSCPWYRYDDMPGRWLGRTVPNKDFETFECTCANCNTMRACLRIQCTVKVAFRIELSVRYIRNAPGRTLKGTYGHEQRHIESLRAGLNIIIQDLSAYERRGCRYCKPEECRRLAKGIASAAQQRFAQYTKDESSIDHDINPTSPSPSWQEYSPIGTMPTSPAGTY